jgi:D5 N terminal like
MPTEGVPGAQGGDRMTVDREPWDEIEELPDLDDDVVTTEEREWQAELDALERPAPSVNGDEPESSAPEHQATPSACLDADLAGDISDDDPDHGLGHDDRGHEDDHEDDDEAGPVAPDGYTLTDTGNADRLVALCSESSCFKYAHAWGRWLVYRDGVWTIDENDALITEQAKGVARGLFRLAAMDGIDSKERERIFKHAVKALSCGAIAAMVKLARGIDGVIVEHEQLDDDPYLLNVHNGTIDLRTGELRPHDPDDLCTKQIQVDYHPDARSQLWNRCLETWQADPKMREYLQREVGAAATGYPTESLSVHYGGGANGKSRFWGCDQRHARRLRDRSPQEPARRATPRRTRHRDSQALP